MCNCSFEGGCLPVERSLQKRNHNAAREAPHGFASGSVFAQAVRQLPRGAVAVVVEEVHVALLGCYEVEGGQGAVVVERCVADAIGSAGREQEVASDGTEARADDERRHA